MKLITREIDYAVRALCAIAQKDGQGVVSVSGLVEELMIPRPFLRKILQALNKKNLLKSYKGNGGGFTLAVPAGRIFLSDLIEAFQGPLKLNECIFKKQICPGMNACILRSKVNSIEKRMIAELRSITIESLINGG